MVETEISGQKSTEKPIINNTEELKPEKNNSKAKDIKKIQHNFSKLSERIKKHKFQHSELLLELRPTVKDTNGFVIISQVESDTVNIKIRASKIDSKKAGEVLLCIFPCELYKFSKSFIHKELKDFKFSKTTDGKLKIGDSQ